LGRIIKEIEIEGRKINALFDTGSWNTYIERDVIDGLLILSIPQPYKVSLGGNTIEVREICLFYGKIEGLGFDGEAIPIDKISVIDGKEVKAIIGALIMEKWELTINPKTGEINLDKLRKREFVEYYN